MRAWTVDADDIRVAEDFDESLLHRTRHETEIPSAKRKAIAQKAARARWSKRKKRPA
jgi:hypothetical protein